MNIETTTDYIKIVLISISIIVYLLILLIGSIVLFFFRPKDQNGEDLEKKIETIKQRERNKSKEDIENERNSTSYTGAYDVLTTYVSQNLNQNKQIYQLTYFTMLAGLFFIVAGTFFVFVEILASIALNTSNTSNTSTSGVLNISWFPVVAGVITEFIAATILSVYKSISTQTSEYFHVLERFSTIGISISVLDDMADDKTTTELKPTIDKLKIETKAEVAKLLIQSNKDITTSQKEN